MSFDRCTQCTYDYPCIDCCNTNGHHQYATQNVHRFHVVTSSFMWDPYHSTTQQRMRYPSSHVQILPRQTIPLPPLSEHTITLNPLLRHQGELRPMITYDLYSSPTSARLASAASSSAHRWYPGYEEWSNQPATLPESTPSVTIRICRGKEVDVSLPPIVVFPASVYQTTVTIADVLRSTNIFCLNHIHTRVGHTFAHYSSSQVSHPSRLPWKGLYRSMDERDVWLLDVS